MTPRTIAHPAPLFVEFSRQEYWGEQPCPHPRDLPDSGIEPASPMSPALQANSLPLESLGIGPLLNIFTYLVSYIFTGV